MPSIKKNEWQRRRFFTFCSLIDVFWPLPHTVEKKCVCLLFSLILYHHSVTMFKYWQILPQKSSSPLITKSIFVTILLVYSCLSEIHEFYNLFVSNFYYSIKFRYCEKATKFEKITHLFFPLLSNIKTRKEIFSNFCGLKISEL